ncbi:MAG TPA: T9SS type A sorting domain-containing protein [Chitinophagales bacterium]|nr:T9SS type A sorting domain-containing protein [Chitinophagales bacterium]
MLNILGEEIRSTSFESLQSSFDLTGINAGIYFLRITDAENRFCVVEMVIVKEKEVSR